MLIEDFITRWKDTEGSERANKDSFLRDLCRVMQVLEPDGKTGDPGQDKYVFEADAALVDENGRQHVGWMDLYKKDHFILEAKQGSTAKGKKKGTARRGNGGWVTAMQDAWAQGVRYARTLENPPPFLIVADIGYCFDLYSCFDGGGQYQPFPHNHKNRLYLKDLLHYVDTLRQIWVDPHSLDPSKRTEAVTVDVSLDLAMLARTLEKRYPPATVGQFLMRCVFCMFAEDIGLLKEKMFTTALEKTWIRDPASFKEGVESLWDAMNSGKSFVIFGKLLHFNGGLFRNPEALVLTEGELKTLLKAAKKEWSEVQPAIFGTLIEKALDEKERHKLGAHFTPASYVERLLRPTVEEPLREEWDGVKAEVRMLVPPNEDPNRANLAKASKLVRAFHQKLCGVAVLDPACGSANFLYLALDIMKRLESEVLALLTDLDGGQLDFTKDDTVCPNQFKGIEIRPQSKEIAELVLWIGYLQWHHRMYGQTKNPPEPILREYNNIECRDALLDAPVGGTLSRAATWPEADFIVGNPPFVGNKRMRTVLGNSYVETLRSIHSDVPDTADYVMYWWNHASRLLAEGKVRSFGLITTNSITQSFNKKVVAAAMQRDPNSRIAFLVPDHPWVDTAKSAAVRIAMSAMDHRSGDGRLGTVTLQSDEGSNSEGGFTVAFRRGKIGPDLQVMDGAHVPIVPLESNKAMCLQGCKLVGPRGGPGFGLTPSERQKLLELRPSAEKYMPRYITGNDLTKAPGERYVIDFFGLTEPEARQAFPEGYQLLLDRVKPFRDKNPRKTRRENWWLFGENAPKLRSANGSLKRFIATSEVAKHRVFTFLPLPGMVADGSLAAISTDDAYVLGVLSSRVHLSWALRQGGTLEDRPRYQNGPCFDPFPFPECDSEAKQQISDLAEELDQHRKRQLETYPELSITALYNTLEQVRSGETVDTMDDVNRDVQEKGLVSVLKRLHDELDAAVLRAYGWSDVTAEAEILKLLVELNHERAAQEALGHIRWLRPGYQQRQKVGKRQERSLSTETKQLSFRWPSDLPGQVTTVRIIIEASVTSMSAKDVADQCVGAEVKKVVPVLETLEALAHVVSFNDNGKRWVSVARLGNEGSKGPGVKKVSSAPPASRAETA